MILTSIALSLVGLVGTHEVQVSGEMRRMFFNGDIKPNVNLAQIVKQPNIYALGPVGGLKGEVLVLDSKVIVSQVGPNGETVKPDPGAKAVFLVYQSVPQWREVTIPASVTTDKELEGWLSTMLPKGARTAFMLQGKASADYHIIDYKGEAKDHTHEAHEKAKLKLKLDGEAVEVLGFFTDRDDDGGKFVHHGQKTHMHLLSGDNRHMGHVDGFKIQPGAKLLLPADLTLPHLAPRNPYGLLGR